MNFSLNIMVGMQMSAIRARRRTKANAGNACREPGGENLSDKVRDQRRLEHWQALNPAMIRHVNPLRARTRQFYP